MKILLMILNNLKFGFEIWQLNFSSQEVIIKPILKRTLDFKERVDTILNKILQAFMNYLIQLIQIISEE